MTSKFDSLLNDTFNRLIPEGNDEDPSADKALKTIKPFAKRWDRMDMKDKAVAMATGGKEMRKSSKVNKKLDKFLKGPHLKKANQEAEEAVDKLETDVKDMG